MLFYVYADLGAIQVIPNHIVNRLGYVTHSGPTVAGVADFYFFTGIFALILAIVVSFQTLCI
jgi:hypothetical protein